MTTPRPRNNIINTIQIDQEIIDAINMYLKNEKININQLAQKIGTQRSTVYGWRTGQIRSIRQQTWLQIYPLLKSYLPGDEKYMPNHQISIGHGTVAVGGNVSGTITTNCNCADGILEEIMSNEKIPPESKVEIYNIFNAHRKKK